ncbi:MAG: flagellar biosynthetic protein FliQ [Bombella apis]|nr:flagellar biosynthetic protein FliQ [Bombella apis]
MTQISEATLSFVPKFIAATATLILTASFMHATIHAYAELIFDQLIKAGGI